MDIESERQTLLGHGPVANHGISGVVKACKRIIIFLLILATVIAFLSLSTVYYRNIFLSRRILEADTEFYRHCVILISLDGFRSGYMTSYPELLQNIDKLVHSGAFARHGMLPIFPTTTFPNHASVVTGVYAETHGMIHNEFYDSELDEVFSYTNASQQRNSEWWWKRTEPIWKTVSKSGLKSAVYAWPGAEALGYTPDYLIPYEIREKDCKHSMNQILTWLDMPIHLRPSFIGVYLEHIDVAAHLYGTNSIELKEALKNADLAIKFLREELKKRRIDESVNVVIISDHGMTDTNISHWIYLDSIISLGTLKYAFYGPIAFLYPKLKDDIMIIYHTLKQYSTKRHGIFTPYLRNDLPNEYHFTNHHRIAPIIIICKSPYCIAASNCSRSPLIGIHGYPVTDDPNMRSLFVASGERITMPQLEYELNDEINRFSDESFTISLESFYNIDIYPFMLELMITDDIKRNGGFHPTHYHNGTCYLVKRLLKRRIY